MIRHISVFVLKEKAEVLYGKRLEELVRLLEKLPDDIPEIMCCVVKRNLSIPQKVPSEGGPVFGDVIQIIDFTDIEAAHRYPYHPAHLQLVHMTENWIEQVTAIDFEV